MRSGLRVPTCLGGSIAQAGDHSVVGLRSLSFTYMIYVYIYKYFYLYIHMVTYVCKHTYTPSDTIKAGARVDSLHQMLTI